MCRPTLSQQYGEGRPVSVSAAMVMHLYGTNHQPQMSLNYHYFIRYRIVGDMKDAPSCTMRLKWSLCCSTTSAFHQRQHRKHVEISIVVWRLFIRSRKFLKMSRSNPSLLLLSVCIVTYKTYI